MNAAYKENNNNKMYIVLKLYRNILKDRRFMKIVQQDGLLEDETADSG